MEFKEIQFIDSHAQRVYRNYIQSIRNATKELTAEDSLEILMEFNSHLYESVQINRFAEIKNSKLEIDNLLNAIDKLGEPEEVLKPFIADKMLDKATRSFKPTDIFKALFLNIGNGIGYFIFGILYFLIGMFTLFIFLRIFLGNEINLFIGDGTYLIGSLDESEGLYVLDNWFIPVMLLLNLALYFIITMALKFKRSINIKYKR